jgi:cell division septum initiation protein DivIVA
LLELQGNNQKLFNELRKANEEYQDSKKDNARLREQISSLKHNLEYYQQSNKISEKGVNGRRMATTARDEAKQPGVSPLRPV